MRYVNKFNALQISANIISQHTAAFGNTENGCFLYLQNIDNQYLCFCKTLSYFTGKERDEETGYGYFGARYMDHELMTMWLSVDPMSDKYPNISPYAYCAWNPVKLVDPNGREVYITGDDAEQATSQLSSRGITVSRDAETGLISYTLTGKRLSESDKRLIEAINSKDVCVNINATNASSVPFNDISLTNTELTGQFLGVIVSDCNNKTAITSQLVNPSLCATRDKDYDVPIGTSILHEITESFEAGKICLGTGRSCDPCWIKYKGVKMDCPADHVYFTAHNNATLQARDAAPIIRAEREEAYFRIAKIMNNNLTRAEWNFLRSINRQNSFAPNL